MDRRFLTFIVVSFGAIFLLSAVKNLLFPPPPAPTAPTVAAAKTVEPTKPLAKPTPEAAALAAAQAVLNAPIRLLHPAPDLEAEGFFRRQAQAARAEADRQANRAKAAAQPDKLIVLGNNKLDVLFSERGAAVRSVTLKSYLTATRDYARPDPQQRPLLLLTDDLDGKLADLPPEKQLERQSYRFTLPDQELTWKLVAQKTDQLVFAAEAPAKNLRITKTFTLKPEVYHVDMELGFAPLDAKSKGEFIYEIAGPYGLQVEGIHWKQSTFRQVVTCVADPSDERLAMRYLDDAMTLNPATASRNLRKEPILFNDPKSDTLFQYSGVMNQFFAALLVAEHGEEPFPPRLADKVTPYWIGDDVDVPKYQRDHFFQGQAGCKLTSLPVKLEGKEVKHKYFLFSGPCKTLLLDYEKDVAPGLEQFYTQRHHLRLLTEAPFNNVFGTFSYAIGWTRLINFFTNKMHWLLENLKSLFGSYGVAILVMTLLVRACMFPISRKQAQNARDMSEKMAKLKPEMKKLEEKYKNDAQAKMAATHELMRKHGVNPLSSCTGCLVLLLQMPVFMGLYYALNESTHLRLAGFLWFPNLAAPDMLVRWNEWPVFASLASGMSLILFVVTLGDFLNLLPMVSALLMFFQQKMMTPPAMDEQQAMQMKMMNWMMPLMGYMFYWVASGLCMYFIVSSAWGMLERKLLPKRKEAEPGAGGAPAKAEDKKAKDVSGRENALAQKAGDLWKKLLKEAEKK